jgi:hypothetical protein
MHLEPTEKGVSRVRAFGRGGAPYGVSEEGRAPPGEDAPEALGARDLGPGIEIALVHLWIDLESAFDQVEGSHGSMRGALTTDEQEP